MNSNHTLKPGIRIVILTAGALALVACAHTVPSELKSARETCERSASGAAAKLVPAELHKATVALAKAEKAFADLPDDSGTRDLAYVAQRRCQIADALAVAASEQRRTASAKDEFATLQGSISDQNQAALDQSQADLSQSQRDLTQSQANLDLARNALKTALAKQAAVKEEPRGLVITLSGSVLFRSDESILLPEAQTRLDQVAEALLASSDRTLLIEGHTDSQGSDEHNRALSQRRADAVRAYLVSRGYPEERITAQGLGEARPVADNTTPEGLSNNRRVEIIVQAEVPRRSAMTQ